VLKVGATLLVGSRANVRASNPSLRVVPLEVFDALWAFVSFEFLGKPAMILRVPKPETPLALERAFEVAPDLFLLGLSRECSHNGCTVDWSTVPAREREFVCHCHGSYFRAADGDRVAGIAPEPLQALQLEVSNGAVYVRGELRIRD
jgi:Rieske Fe-S protein